jgi:hypothetical protein
MNSFFILYKQRRADKIINEINKHIDVALAQYKPYSIPVAIVEAVTIYCNDYKIKDEEGDDAEFKKIGDI